MKTLTLKFGGTSVGSVEAITHVLEITRGELEQGNHIVLVLSAMSGVTDMLIESVNLAVKGDKWGYLSLSKKIRDRHEETINLLMHPGKERERVLGEINDLLDHHIELCQAVNILGETTARVSDAVVSLGERLSVRMVAAALRERDIRAQAYDGGEFIVTNNQYQNAGVLWDETEKRIQSKLMPLLEGGTTPVITGFVGATVDGAITTLGRGGSDYSGAIFAAYTDSDELVIWTDVDGVMTTDPRIDPRAKVLPYVSYSEVGELSYYGAKVLHPKTVHPIINKGIPLRVRNTFNPEFPGTLIQENGTKAHGIIKAVTAIRSVSMMTLSGRAMMGVPGIAGRTFLATARVGANILMISQSSSEQSICFTVTDDKADSAKQSVEEELAAEIAQNDVDGVTIRQDVVIITTVGAGMRGTPGVAGRVFTVLGDQGINVLALAQGSSECSISFVVEERELERAVRVLHDLALESVPE